jgi:hypothetical protein
MGWSWDGLRIQQFLVFSRILEDGKENFLQKIHLGLASCTLFAVLWLVAGADLL